MSTMACTVAQFHVTVLLHTHLASAFVCGVVHKITTKNERSPLQSANCGRELSTMWHFTRSKRWLLRSTRSGLFVGKSLGIDCTKNLKELLANHSNSCVCSAIWEVWIETGVLEGLCWPRGLCCSDNDWNWTYHKLRRAEILYLAGGTLACVWSVQWRHWLFKCITYRHCQLLRLCGAMRYKVYGALVEWHWQVKTKVLRDKAVLVPLCIQQIPFWLAPDWKQACRWGSGKNWILYIIWSGFGCQTLKYIESMWQR